MSFSKKTLLAAALFIGSSALVPADDTITMTSSTVGNITITDNTTITVEGGTAYTINGLFVSEAGNSFADGYTSYDAAGEETVVDAVTSAEDAEGWFSDPNKSWLTSLTVTISGGGTLSLAGSDGSGYYSSSYTQVRGNSLMDDTRSEILEAWNSIDSFWNNSVYYGNIVVGEGTTLNVSGDAQLVQYVSLYVGNSRTSSTAASPAFSYYIGVNSITLEAGATLSFEEANLNLREDLSDVTSEYVTALQIIQNLYADATSSLVIGTDTASSNRIVLYTGTDDATVYASGSVSYNTGAVSTVGRLVGNGRFYTFGSGAVAFIGESELNSGTNNDTTGHTWISGNLLADIILENSEVYVGSNPIVSETEFLSDSEALAAAVDNVFAGATAVHIGTAGGNSNYTVITSGSSEVVVGAAYVGSAAGDTEVTVYGNQTFNNFESLWIERSALLSDSDITASGLLESEPVKTSYYSSSSSSVVFDTGSGTTVRVAGGSVLTINQEEYCDGWYAGSLVTHLYETEDEGATEGTESIVAATQDNGDGLIVKTGSGKFYYNGGQSSSTLTGYLSKLRIEEGTWATTVKSITGTDIELTGSGQLELLVGSSTGNVEMDAMIRATDASVQLVFSTFTVLENDLTSGSLEEAEGTDDLSEVDLEYRSYTVNMGRTYSASVQIVTEQSQFYGTVVVNDGLTLVLGDSDSGESSPSIFSSAAGIVLNGANDDDSRYDSWSDEEIQRLAVSTLLVASGNQLVSNLSGESGHSAVEISSGATLVLTSTADSEASYYGTFSGNGSLIRFGGGRSDSGTTVSDSVNVSGSDLFGSLFVMSDSATVTTSSANAGFAGLVLANKAAVEYSASDGAAKVGALVGESGTTLSFSGTLTVGDMSLSTGLRTGGSYLATSNYSAYTDYFSGTSVESVLSALTTNVTNARGSGTTSAATYESTLAYLANPADLVYQASTNSDASASDYSDYVLDGAFARTYATTGTDHSGTDVFSAMKSSTSGAEVFGSANSVSAWLKSVFTVEAVEEYLDSSDAQLSSEMQTSLIELATTISGSASGVNTYLDSDGNLAVAGWNEIVAAGGLYYLKSLYSDLNDLADDTLYSFITYFYEDYEFTLTQDNATLIASDYDLSSSSWITVSASSATGYVANYAAFIESFGVESTEFAGKLTGSGALIKTGAETLALTGYNTYTGQTYVQAGELYVKWYAVQYTAGIEISSNALLTIDAQTTDETGSYDTSGDDDVALTLGSDYGQLLSGAGARITGNGIVLKTGNGKVDLGYGLYDNSDGEFTGTFLVAEGEILATIDSEERVAELDDDTDVPALNFGIEFTTDSGAEADDRIFRLEFATVAGSDAVEVELVGNGTIAVTGTGTFILDAGTSDLGYRNILSVDAANVFDPTNVEVESGALKIIVSSDDATSHPENIALATGTQLIFDLEKGVTEVDYADVTITGGSANVVLTVSATEEDRYDTAQRALSLSNSVISGVTALELTGLAKLSLTTDTETTTTLLSVTSLTGDEDTELSLGGGYRIAVDVDYAEDDDGNEIKSVFAGTLTSVALDYTAERTISEYDETTIAALDVNDDGIIDENDVGTVTAAVYDTDGDGTLDEVTVTTVAYFTGTLRVDYDVNGDGVINSSDTVTVTYTVTSDVNEDDVVDENDITVPETYTLTVTDDDGNTEEVEVTVSSSVLTVTSTEIVTTVSWDDTGTGTLVKDGTGTLVIGNTTAASEETTTTAFSGTLVFAQGTIELLAGENVTLDYTGTTIIGEDSITQGSSNDTRTLVKDGAGTVKILSDGENYVDVDNLEIVVNDGELWMSGTLFASGDELPASVEIADSAAFRLVDMESDISVEDLSVSGTGTLEFNSYYEETETDDDGNETTVTGYNAVTVYVTSNSLTQNFTGTVSISEGVTLELGTKVTSVSGISGEGTVSVGNSSGALTITVDGNADGAEVFAGTFENLKSLTVVGEGAFSVASSSVEELGTITVGSSSENGGIGITADWTGTIKAVGSTSRILVYSEGTDSDTLTGTVVVASSVDNLILSYDSEIALGDTAVADTFSLKDSDGETTLVLDGSIGATLSNIAGTDLTLTNLSELNNEVFSLSTNEGGVIIFAAATTDEDEDEESESTLSASALRVAATSDDTTTETTTDTDSGTWDGDITGSGGIVVASGADLTLTSSTLSYTGSTTVETGATLTYAAAGTVSASSGLYVETGATVVGGVSLTGEDTTVVFESGSTLVYTGSAIEFTGSAEVSGEETITVKLDASALSVRGQAVSIFNYIGDDEAAGTNAITFDKISFTSDDGVGWYRDGQDDDAATETGSTTIYLVTDDLASLVSLHDGLSANFVNELNALTETTDDGYFDGDLTEAQEELAVAIIKTTNGAMSGVLNNLSPLSYGAMLALPQAGFLNDIAAISSRLEARRYDSYSTYVWDTHHDWEFFAQAQGTYTDADSDTDTRTFDMDIYGVIAGADLKISETTVAGFAIAYDYGKADIHDSGGKIESNDVRATAFFGRTFDSRFYLDAGAQIGWASFDVKRDTILGSADGDTNGLHAGVFATFGALLPMFESEDEKTMLSLMPYVGVSASYYSVDSFDESGSAAALDSDSFDATSVRATIGASLVWTFRMFDKQTRINLDFSYTRELLDNDVDIDYEMPSIVSGSFTASAIAFAEDTFSIGPRISYDLTRDTSIYAGYRFEATTDSDTAHSANIGFRTRF